MNEENDRYGKLKLTRKKRKVRRIALDTPDVKRLKKLMVKYELSQKRIADILKVSQATVSNWMVQDGVKRDVFNKLKALSYC